MKTDVFELIKPARNAMIISAILTGCGAILSLMPYVAMTNMAMIWLEESTSTGWAAEPWIWAAIGIACLAASQVLYFMGLGITHTAEAKLRHHLRQRLVQALARLPLGRVSQVPPGRIRKMVCDDTAAIHTLVAHVPGDATNAFVAAIAGAAYLIWVDWRMAVALLAIWGLLFAVVFLGSMRGFGKITEEFGEAQSRLAGDTVEMLHGMQEIKNFQATDKTRTTFNASREVFSTISYRWASQSGRLVSLMTAMLRPASIFGTVAVLAVVFTSQGWTNLSSTLPFFMLAPTLPEGFSTLIGLMQHTYESRMAAGATADLLAEEPMPEGTATEAVEGAVGHVELQDVRFSYEPGHEVAKGVSFAAGPGTVTALVGPSGSGKSTLARLIARFYDTDSGTVRVGGHDVRDTTFGYLYSQLAIVLQDAQVTHDSVFDNIALSRPNASSEEVVRAAQAACIHERIMQLPDGYDTVLGDKGGFLSGGEQQRICLARAYLQDAPVLVLDEATAQADPQSEREIHKALARLAQGRTVIVVAHRLWTVQDADQILFLEDGRIVEQGKHSDLMARNGRYATMWRSQETGTSSLTQAPADRVPPDGQPDSVSAPSHPATPAYKES